MREPHANERARGFSRHLHRPSSKLKARDATIDKGAERKLILVQGKSFPPFLDVYSRVAIARFLQLHTSDGQLRACSLVRPAACRDL